MLIPAVVPQNPNLKEMVGEFIYNYVEKFVGEANAGKITGMLLDLKQEEIKKYLYDFTYLYQKIGEAANILKSAQGVQHQWKIARGSSCLIRQWIYAINI